MTRPVGEFVKEWLDSQGYPLEFRPEGRLLFLENADVPGVVGKIGTLLAGAQVNIADIHLARRPVEGSGGREALAVLRVDQAADDELVARLAALPEVRSVRAVEL